MEITLTEVTSKEIFAIGHDEASSTLEICFRGSRAIYHYQNFPRAKFIEFAIAPSIGTYFYKNIKCRADLYPYTKITT